MEYREGSTGQILVAAGFPVDDIDARELRDSFEDDAAEICSTDVGKVLVAAGFSKPQIVFIRLATGGLCTGCWGDGRWCCYDSVLE